MQETLLFIYCVNRPVVKSAEEPDDPEFEDAAHCRAALLRPDVESAAIRDEPDTGDAEPYRAALHRPVVEAAGTEERDDPDAKDAALYRQLFTYLL